MDDQVNLFADPVIDCGQNVTVGDHGIAIVGINGRAQCGYAGVCVVGPGGLARGGPCSRLVFLTHEGTVVQARVGVEDPTKWTSVLPGKWYQYSPETQSIVQQRTAKDACRWDLRSPPTWDEDHYAVNLIGPRGTATVRVVLPANADHAPIPTVELHPKPGYQYTAHARTRDTHTAERLALDAVRSARQGA